MKELSLEEKNKRTNLAQYNNSWYNPGPRWKRSLWLIINVIFFNNGLAVFTIFKCWLLRKFGAKIGSRVVIKPSVNIKYPWFLHIGDDVWIGEKVWIDSLAQITIGNNVCISQGAVLLTGNHNYKKIFFDLKLSPVVLEDGVWIGANSIVCPGVICKTHAVLTVGSVATRNLESYSIYQGNPAERVKQRIIE
ncbi:WcaF family extracellular polysaccharide biosynthesis acetyltransferase [Segetibacter koreensis]|uniref:WcaF family extracellular polysaccharide biosynthesis acetyltransferase n=1 Tax=Segetibacter koreensis TaxID=398037 RepID=UPI000360161A|nr:WcaF family extracellular polysaccharide biosynthesis acetyltransferase [Segetibacter koreensis]